MLIYSFNNSITSSLKHFNSEIKKIPSDNVVDKMEAINSEVITLISLLDIEYLFISITSSGSIFYRFRVFNSPFEFKWNIFINSNEDENSTLIIYNNNYKQSSYYGSVSELYATIGDTLNEVAESYFELYPSGSLYEDVYAG